MREKDQSSQEQHNFWKEVRVEEQDLLGPEDVDVDLRRFPGR